MAKRGFLAGLIFVGVVSATGPLCSAGTPAPAAPRRQETILRGGGEEMKQDLEIIQQRLLERALQGNPKPEEVTGHAKSLREDGSWADVDYQDQGRAGWATSKHLQRVLAMAQAYRNPKNALKGDARLQEAVALAMGFWTRNDFQNPNWYHNKITVPKMMSTILLLMQNDLSPEQIKDGLKIVKHSQLGMTGANLVWLAEVAITRACLEGNPDLAMEAFERIAGEIQITMKEGIQPDFSFHQHGAQLYSGGYGLGFAADCPRFAVLAHGTEFEFPRERLEILARYILDGEQWMVRGKTFDYSACGRGLSRTGGDSAAKLIPVCQNMAIVFPERKAEFEAFARRLEGEPALEDVPLVGNRHFWRGDFMTHERKDFHASVRMTSNRLIQTEKVNDENQRGEHLADGVTYIERSGEEYRNIFPAWEWRRIPGTTCEQQPQPPEVGRRLMGERAFVGGVSDGLYGLAAEDFARGPLSARKAWFFFDRELVCLGAGIACPTDNAVLTSINQCLLKGPVAVSDGTRRATVAGGDRLLQKAVWVFHDGVGYVFSQGGAVHLKNEAQSGSWWEINWKYKKEPVSADVFSLWIDHGKQIRDQAYCYVVAPGVGLDEMDRYAGNLPFAVLQNTTRLQAVWNKESALLGAAFYEAGQARTPDGLSIGVDKPCLAMLRKTDKRVWISVSNPENQPLEVGVTVNQRLKGEGCVWMAEARATRVSFVLPAEMYAGQSVTRELETE